MSTTENTYPRLAAESFMLDVYPRPACIHDPMGILASCDICGERKGVCVKESK